MATFPGKSDLRSAPYSRAFAAGAASSTSLISLVEQARCATTALFCLVATTANVQLTYKDSSGTTVDTGLVAMTAGQFFELPVGAIELTTNTNLIVIAYWHPSNAR